MTPLLITAIKNNPGITLTQLEHRATKRGVPLSELYAALETIHKDKTIKQSTKGDEVIYTYVGTVKVKQTFSSHLTWVRRNYPPMDDTNDGSGLEADYSYLFFDADAMKEYKSELTGGIFKRNKVFSTKKRSS